MKELTKMMVCLDLTEMDDKLISYSFFLAQTFKTVQKVYFVHNIKFDFPDVAQEIFNDLEQPLGEIISDDIIEKVGEYLNATSQYVEYEVILTEDSSTPAALAKIAKQNEVQLLITGRKISYPGSGQVAEKLLRIPNFKANLLLVPETAFHQITQILVPTDFSKASKKAIEFGGALQQITSANLQCQHVFNIPTHYFPYIPVDNLVQKLSTNAQKQWQAFSKTLHLLGTEEIKCELIFSERKNIAQAIYDHAIHQQKDLVVISAKGKGSITSFLIGSVAIRLIQMDMHIPLLVIK